MDCAANPDHEALAYPFARYILRRAYGPVWAWEVDLGGRRLTGLALGKAWARAIARARIAAARRPD